MDDPDALHELRLIAETLAEQNGAITADVGSLMVLRLGKLIHRRQKPMSAASFQAVLNLMTALRDDIMT